MATTKYSQPVPVRVVESGGVPVTQADETDTATPIIVVNPEGGVDNDDTRTFGSAMAVRLVDSGGLPVHRVDQEGNRSTAPLDKNYFEDELALDFVNDVYRLPTGYDTDLLAMRGPELADEANYGVPISFDNGLTVTSDSSFTTTPGTTACRAYLNLTTEVGKSYEIVHTFDRQTNSVTTYARAGSNGSGTVLATSSADATSLEFTATSTTSCVLWTTTATGASFDLSGISVREVPATYTRSGAKSELAASTGLVSFAENEPGIVPGVGYWSRGAVTNLVTTSNPLTGEVDPDGGTNAGLSQLSQVAPTVSTATTYTFSRFVKRSDTDWLRMVVYETASSGNQLNVWFNLATGAYGSNSALGSGITLVGTPKIEAVTAEDGSQWYRIWMGFQSATATGLTARTQTVSAEGSITGSGAHYFWQAQLVTGTQAGPIIVTTGSAATVGADDMRLLPPITADEDFIMWAVVDLKRAAGTVEYFLNVNDGTTNNRLSLARDAAGNLSGAVTLSGISTYISPVLSQVSAGRAVVLLRRSGGNWSMAGRKSDGTIAIATSTAGFPVGLNRFDVGQQVGGGQPNSPIEFVGIRRGTFTDAEITEILENA